MTKPGQNPINIMKQNKKPSSSEESFEKWSSSLMEINKHDSFPLPEFAEQNNSTQFNQHCILCNKFSNAPVCEKCLSDIAYEAQDEICPFYMSTHICMALEGKPLKCSCLGLIENCQEIEVSCFSEHIEKGSTDAGI